jgi:hypothetical protein
MDDVIYRFRPVSRLLNDDGVSGELDSQYIYFAGVEQLNDPLEGYKEVFFDGDHIVWMNLLRNYLQCLYRHCINFAINPSGTYDLSEYILNVMSDIPPDVTKYCDSVIDDFLSEPIVPQFISIWSTLGEASLSEVFNYVDVVHFLALESITKALSKAGLFSVPPTFDNANRALRLKVLEDYVSVFANSEIGYQSKKLIMEKYWLAKRERELLDRYEDFGNKGMPALFYEMIAFPDKYCAALAKSIHPQWYVACFMEDCENSSIWGSYGGNHKDVCLEFNVPQSSDQPGLTLLAPTGWNGRDEDYIWSKVMMRFKGVSYDKAFPRVDFFNSFGGLTNQEIYKYWYCNTEGETSIKAKQFSEENDVWRSAYWAGFEHSTTVKVADWHHEREFRLIQMSSMFSLSKPELRKLKYDFSSLKGIIFGINTSMNDKCKLIARVQKLCKLHKREDFNFYQARYDHTSKKIVRDLLSFIRAGFDKKSDRLNAEAK